MPSPTDPVLLFDGVCTLCNRSVQFIIDHEASHALRFASLQSSVGQELLAAHGLRGVGLDSVVLIQDGRGYVRSGAALRVARYLRPPWRWLWVARHVPSSIRDRVYDWVARNRTRWFGTQDACRLATPALRDRFLDASEPGP